MKKVTWSEVKEKGKQFYQENKEYCLVVGGVIAGVALDMAVDLYLEKKHYPKEVTMWYSTESKTNCKMRFWNVDQYGNETYATGLDIKPAAAIHMAREILYDLAGEAK